MKDHPSEKRMTTGKLTELALLTAAALILYVVELQIPNPIPIPGAKLGPVSYTHPRMRQSLLMTMH